MKAALLVAGGIVVCCALILAGQPTALENHASSLLPAPFFEKTPLPYDGPGRVAVFADGTVSVTVGEWQVLESDAGEVTFFAPGESVALQLKGDGLALVEDLENGEFFVDRSGRQVRARELSPEQVLLVGLAGEPSQTPGKILLSILGDLAVDSGADPGAFEFTIDGVSELNDDGDAEPRVFAMEGRTLPVREPATEASAKLQQTPERPGERDPEPGGGPSCSVSCAGGSCNISCPKLDAAICYCQGSRPVCYCTRTIPIEI